MNSSESVSQAHIEADIVVIGGGGAGLAAAATAAEKCARVVLLEKQAIGGNSAMAVGILAAESQLQKYLNIATTKEEVVRIAMEYSHWKIDRRIYDAFVGKSADTVDWLEAKGISFDIGPNYPGQYPITFHRIDGGGAAIIKALRKSCEDLGVKLFTHCPAKKILTGETGEVIGVVAATDDKEFTIATKSVIIATGGYSGNKDLLKKYFPSYCEDMILDGLPLMGDGLFMAIDIGAATEGLGNLMLHPPLLPGASRDLFYIPRDPRGLWVNKKGVRFTDESVGQRATECGNALNRQPDNCAYVLWDEDLKNLIAKEARGKRPLLGTMGGRKTPIGDLDERLRAQVESGNVRISESWAEIAEWMGARSEDLNSTIDEYNLACEKGYDEVFGKVRNYLLALRTPPYYALKCFLSYVTTMGGVKIDHNMRVIDRQDDPIAGLYAAGDVAGGWESESYTMILAGSACGFALNSGRIAGGNAAKYVLKG